jgi:hypothetical protein
MKIIQSFAQFKEGSPYSNKNVFLNFYSFYLSYLTLNKYYGNVTMICNEEAYNSFIKYIPYDEIIIKENKNDINFWNAYKIDAMKIIDDDIIHVDSDVFIFDDLFSEFINNDYWDIMVQDITPAKDSYIVMGDFVKDNEKFLSENDIIYLNEYDNRFTSCGTFGIKKRVRDIYFNAVDKLHTGIKNGVVTGKNLSILMEELTAYLVSIHYNLKLYDILTHELIVKYNKSRAGDIKKYTHLWFGYKFTDRNITLMKNKVRQEFPHNYSLIDKYEMEVLNEIKI